MQTGFWQTLNIFSAGIFNEQFTLLFTVYSLLIVFYVLLMSYVQRVSNSIREILDLLHLGLKGKSLLLEEEVLQFSASSIESKPIFLTMLFEVIDLSHNFILSVTRTFLLCAKWFSGNESFKEKENVRLILFPML